MGNSATPKPTAAEHVVREMFREVDVVVNGDRPFDIQVLDPRFYARLLRHSSLGLGESYVERWWEVESLDEFIHRILVRGLHRRFTRNPRAMAYALLARIANPQARRRTNREVRSHYELGLDVFHSMLDRRMAYSCGYWRDASTLDQAQEEKLELVCRKLGLREGMSLLDIGCGWGSLVHYAAERYGVQATGITVSPEQAAFARERCGSLPVTIRVEDYRDVTGTFDAVASIGMFEHVGPKNYRAYMQAVDRVLAPNGISLVHTIAGNSRTSHADPWVRRYIFPGGNLPTLAQITGSAEGLFLVEDVHNFGPDYDRTLLAWHRNFETAWPTLKGQYDENFHRTWRYYLLSCAGAFRARFVQLFQVIFTRPGRERSDLEWLEPRLQAPTLRERRPRAHP